MKKINTDVLIIGAGPVGLFTVFELGQLGMKACIVDSLEDIGGQCTALYPDKPIYDIPAYPSLTAEELIFNLKKQIDPFKPTILLNQKVNELYKYKDFYSVKTTEGNIVESKCIIIAAGNGAFGPNKPPIEKIDSFENKTIFYHVKNKSEFNDKTLAIAGGGDSAVDWAIELSKVSKKIFFIHRRNKLRAAPQNVQKLYSLEKEGKIEIMIPYQLDSIEGENGIIDFLIIKNMEEEKKKLNVDFFLPFFGLSTNLGPIKNWELELEKNILKVKQETCETNLEGIFAIGDVCSYPGKLKLILTGFSEAAIASHNCYNRINPNKVLHFEYSTTKGINKL
ncbi:MAG: NAD(P)/FAD-dependent oxidoreductase [Pseudomonadota bacterium]|nr:NAD(P)/FAD-dependent oxidoreductase [Pseudomonadota bacterium]